MGRIIFSIPDDEHERFRRWSDDVGIPMSRLLRDAVQSIVCSGFPCNVVISGNLTTSGYLVPFGG